MPAERSEALVAGCKPKEDTRQTILLPTAIAIATAIALNRMGDAWQTILLPTAIAMPTAINIAIASRGEGWGEGAQPPPPK